MAITDVKVDSTTFGGMTRSLAAVTGSIQPFTQDQMVEKVDEQPMHFE